MKLFIQTFFLFLLATQFLFAQKKIPVLNANSKSISVREGDFTYKNFWTISPELKPDIFVTNPFKGTKEVIFYTDIDTISFSVEPNKKYDFIISLNGYNAAYTQIDTDIKKKPTLKPKLSMQRKDNTKNTATDSLNFTLGKNSYIYLKGKVNNSDSLDFLFDTGAGMSVITSSLIESNKVKVKIDGQQKNSGSDGISNVSKSSKNVLEIGNLIWKDVPMLSIDYKGFPFDVVLGWVAFEDKIVEINYDKKVLVIHNSLPAIDSEFSKSEIKYIDGVPYIKGRLITNGKETEEWFDFDTGSDGTLIVGQKFAAASLLNGSLRTIGTSRSIGSTGIEFSQKIVRLPILKLGNFELYQVPISINDKDPQGVEYNEVIGNKILKRFNTILDFKNNAIYLKPNSLFYSPM